MIPFVAEDTERGEGRAAVGMDEQEKCETALLFRRKSILRFIGGDDSGFGQWPSRSSGSVVPVQIGL